MSENNDKQAKKPAKKETLYSVRILKHKTKVGGVICAEGATVKLPKDKADAMVDGKLGEITGII